MTGWLLVIVPILAGIASTLQATSNGALAGRVGLPGALLISIAVSAAAIVVLYLVQGSDHFGLLGQPHDPVTAVRAAGVGLLVAGTLLMRWR